MNTIEKTRNTGVWMITLMASVIMSGCGETSAVSISDSGEFTQINCWEQKLEECNNFGNCQLITARKYNDEKECLEETIPVGCRNPEEIGCDLSMSCGVSPDDDIWVFTTTCIPRGWTNVTQNEECFARYLDSELCKLN